MLIARTITWQTNAFICVRISEMHLHWLVNILCWHRHGLSLLVAPEELHNANAIHDKLFKYSTSSHIMQGATWLHVGHTGLGFWKPTVYPCISPAPQLCLRIVTWTCVTSFVYVLSCFSFLQVQIVGGAYSLGCGSCSIAWLMTASLWNPRPSARSSYAGQATV